MSETKPGPVTWACQVCQRFCRLPFIGHITAWLILENNLHKFEASLAHGLGYICNYIIAQISHSTKTTHADKQFIKSSGQKLLQPGFVCNTVHYAQSQRTARACVKANTHATSYTRTSGVFNSHVIYVGDGWGENTYKLFRFFSAMLDSLLFEDGS